MVSAIGHTPVKWFAPTALWRIPGTLRLSGGNGAAGQPAILRFSNDLFMEELLGITQDRPEQLAHWLAQPETWREPMPTPNAGAPLQLQGPRLPARPRPSAAHRRQIASQPRPTAGNTNLPLKLYQPAQQRFYLVGASLVVPKHGLPDQVTDRAKREQTGFVLRRLGEGDPNDPNRVEYAFIAGADGFHWQRVPADARERLLDNEERQPLFAITYRQCQRDRQLLAGLVPVARREAYLTAAGWEPDAGAATTATPGSRLRALFEVDVAAPWKALIEQADIFENAFLQAPTADEDDRARQRAEYRSAFSALREQLQTGSWYLLLDFAGFLQNYLAPVWDHLRGRLAATALNPAEQDLASAIRATTLANGLRDTLASKYGPRGYRVETRLADALLAAATNATSLEDAATPLDLRLAVRSPDNPWPGFLFPLAHPAMQADLPEAGVDQHGPLPPAANGATTTLAALALEDKQARIDQLADLIEAALPADPGPLPDIQPPPAFKPQAEAWFVIRCVYERPRCRPTHRVDVSAPTVPFQMASFFDPDAPARPIKIPMPMDISPAGLRKYKKNTTFMISDMLCGQLKKMRKLTLADLVLSVLPWPFHKDLPDVGANGGPCQANGLNVGMFCSLSIPIVTLCAMILLIIMVVLFDMIFRWLPYLFVCLPIPGLKGKKP